MEAARPSPVRGTAHTHDLDDMTSIPRSQTTPPRFASHALASPFKSGGVANKTKPAPYAHNHHQRLRSRAGMDARPSAPWFGGVSPSRAVRLEGAPEPQDESPSSGGRTRVQSWARGVIPPGESRPSAMENASDGSPISPAGRLAPRGYLDMRTRQTPRLPLAPCPSSDSDVRMKNGDAAAPSASCRAHPSPPPRQSPDDPLERPTRPVFKHRKSAPHQRRPEGLRDGRLSPGSGHLDDIFLDTIASSASASSTSSASSPIADKVPPMRSRLMTRRTTVGETSGWALGHRAAHASSAVLFGAKDSVEVALQSQADDLTSPLGVKFGHGYIEHEQEPMAPDTSPILFTRKRPSPGADENPPTRRRADADGDSPPQAPAAPRPTRFRRITAPAAVNDLSQPWRGISTPDQSAQGLPSFVAERPSPLAFVSSGLSKKGTPGSTSQRSSISSGISGSGILASNAARRAPSALSASCITAESIPDTPIRPCSSVESLRRLAQRPPAIDTAMRLPPPADNVRGPVLVSAITPTEPDFSPVTIPASRSLSTSRGLRRKRSAMWTRTQSGSLSGGSWYGGSDGFEIEPTTPTREQDALGERGVQNLVTTLTPCALSDHHRQGLRMHAFTYGSHPSIPIRPRQGRDRLAVTT